MISLIRILIYPFFINTIYSHLEVLPQLGNKNNINSIRILRLRNKDATILEMVINGIWTLNQIFLPYFHFFLSRERKNECRPPWDAQVLTTIYKLTMISQNLEETNTTVSQLAAVHTCQKPITGYMYGFDLPENFAKDFRVGWIGEQKDINKTIPPSSIRCFSFTLTFILSPSHISFA